MRVIRFFFLLKKSKSSHTRCRTQTKNKKEGEKQSTSYLECFFRKDRVIAIGKLQ